VRRAAAIVAWWLLWVSLCSASDALILIQPAIAGGRGAPAVSSPLWILWPREIYRPGHSALLSLVTGEDWLGDNHDSLFTALPDGSLRAQNGAAMERRGVFEARRRFLGSLETFALPGPERSFHETALLLCVEGAKQPIRVIESNEPWPSHGLVVHEASSWKDVEDIVRHVDRAIVAEYPAPIDQPWSRMWLLGDGWRNQVPISQGHTMPGLIPARSVLDLLTSPARFKWVSGAHPTWAVTPLWLMMVWDAAPAWRTGFGFVLGVLLCVGLALALRERESKLLPELLSILLLVPAASVLGGNLVRLGDDAVLPLTVIVALFASYAVSKAGQLASLRWIPDAHPLLAPAAVSWLSLTFANPLWSPLSGVFGVDRSLPVAAFGSWFASLVATCAFVRGSTLTGEWIVRIGVLCTSAACLIGRAWWAPAPVPFVFLPLIGLAFGDGFWRLAMAPCLPLIGALTTPGLLYGIAWKQNGLLSKASDAQKLNGSEYVSFLISPLFVGTCTLVFLFSLLADRFLLHQYRRLIADDPRRLAVFAASLGLALVGITQPSLLPAALWCAVAGLTILVLDGLRVL
jgi:hypothetical protein